MILDSARRKTLVAALARWLLGLGIATNVAHDLRHGFGIFLGSDQVAGYSGRFRPEGESWRGLT